MDTQLLSSSDIKASDSTSVRRLLGTALSPDSPFRRHWLAFLEQVEADTRPGVMAYDGRDPVGLVQFLRRPTAIDDFGVGPVALYVLDDYRAGGGYDCLVPAAEVWLAERDYTCQYVCLPPTHDLLIDALTARGFVEAGRFVTFSGPTDAPPTTSIEGISLDILLDGPPPEPIFGRLATFLRKTLAKRELLSATDGPSLNALMASPASGWVIATDREKDQIIGASEVDLDLGTFSFIAVARSHWGTPLADRLTARTLLMLKDLGHDRATTAVRASNAASIALHKRFHAEATGDMVQLAKPVDPPMTA